MGIGTLFGGNLAAGQIIVIDINGNIKIINEGDQVLPGEVIVKSDGTLEAQPEQDIQVELVGDDGELQDISAEIEDIFAALEEGQDPTQLGEDFATAAGGNSGSSLTVSGSVTRDGSETIAQTNFDTQGLQSLGLSQTQSLTLLQQFRQFAPNFVDTSLVELGDNLALSTEEDTALAGQLSATDSNGDELVYSQTSDASNGTVTVNPNGSWEYVPNENYNGPDSFTVQVSDGQGGIDTLTINIAVTPVNDAPTFVDESNDLLVGDIAITTKEDEAASGAVQATDVDGDDLTYSVLSQGENGTVTVDADGNWEYTPSAEYNGPDTFEIQVSDGQGGVDTVTVDVTVLAVAEMSVTAGEAVVEDDESYLSFTIELDQAVSEDVVLDLTLGDESDTAEKGEDYLDNLFVSDGEGGYRALTEEDLTIATGDTELVVYVRIQDDLETEATESVTLVVNSESEFVEAPTAQDTGSIEDDRGDGIETGRPGADEDAPSLVVTANEQGGDVIEGESGDGNHFVNFTVSLDGPAHEAIEVTLETLGSATAGEDYQGLEYKNADGEWVDVVDGKITIGADGAAVEVRARVNDDLETESTESVRLRASTDSIHIDDRVDSDVVLIRDDRGDGIETGRPGADEDAPSLVVTANEQGGDVIEGESGDGNHFVNFTVSLDGPAHEAIEVTLETLGSATAGEDYQGLEYKNADGEWVDVVNGKITIGADGAAVEVRARVNDDLETESTESVRLRASTESIHIDDRVDSDVVLIRDDRGDGIETGRPGADEDAPSLVVTANEQGGDVIEGESGDGNHFVNFTVSLDGPAHEAIEVTLETLGSATAGEDYQGLEYKNADGEWVDVVDGKITIGADGVAVEVRARVNDDLETESTESVRLRASTDSIHIDDRVDSDVVLIRDDRGDGIETGRPGADEDAPSLVVTANEQGGDVIEGESGDGNHFVNFTVSLDGPAHEAIEVTLETLGSATAGEDYQGLEYKNSDGEWVDVVDGKITIGADGAAVEVRARVNDDLETESTESVRLRASTESIHIDDRVDSDVVLIRDDRGDGIETGRPGADEDAPSLVVTANEQGGDVIEGESGDGNHFVNFTVSLDGPAHEAIEVTLETLGSATAGEDYQGLEYKNADGEWVDVVDGKITIGADGAAVEVRARVNDDLETESTESVRLRASTESIHIDDRVDSDVVLIKDDLVQREDGSKVDADAPDLEISGGDKAREGEETYLNYEVSLSGEAFGEVNTFLDITGTASDADLGAVQIKLPNGEWQDYDEVNGFQTPDSGVVKVRVEVLDDSETETRESVIVTATTDSNHVNAQSASAQGIIKDDLVEREDGSKVDADAPDLEISGGDKAREGEETYLNYEVSLSGEAFGEVNTFLDITGTASDADLGAVQIKLPNGEWQDYDEVNGFQTPDSGVVKVRVEVLDDNETETRESVIVTATTDSNHVNAQSASAQGIIKDDLVEREDGSKVDADAPDLEISGGDKAREGEETYLNYEVSLSGEAFGEVNTFLDITGTASDADLGAVQIKLPNGEWQDYDEVNGFQTPDSGVVKVRVEVLDDNETETRESVIVTATTDSNHVNAQSASAQGIIKDDLVEREDGSKVDADAPDLEISGGDKAREGEETYLNYEVSLSGEAFGEVNTFLDITGTASDADLGAVQIKLPNGEWQDYDEVNGFQTPDSGVVKVRVEVLDDNETETRESVIVTATTDSNHVNAQSASAQGIIKDDLVEREDGSKVDADAPDLEISGGDKAREGEETYLNYEVSLSGEAFGEVNTFLDITGTASDADLGAVQIKLPNGEWQDYDEVNGFQTPDSGVVKVRVEVLDDNETETRESVIVTATTDSNHVNAQSASAQGIIKDDLVQREDGSKVDADAPDLEISGGDKAREGEETYLNYEVSLSGEAFGEVNTFLDITGTASDADLGAVQIKLPNGEWQDYDEVNGFQTPDSGVVKVRVEVLDDNETETRESVIVTATTDSNHVNAQSASAQGIIKDDLVEREDGSKVDEDAPDIVVTGGDNLTESDDAYLTYEVKLSGPAANDVDVVLTLGGDATVGSDYENKVEYFNGSIWETYNGSLTLPADAEGVQVRIAVIDDLETEEVEGVSLTATTTDNNVAGQSASDTVYIFDDRSNSKPDYDEDIPDLTVTGAGTVSEGDIATFTVNLSKPIDEIVTLDVRTKVSGSSNTAEADDIGDLEVYYFKDGDKTYLELDGNLVSIPANVQDIYVEVPTVDDNGAPVFEGPEQFQLVVRDINSVTTDSNGKATAEATIDDSGAASGDTPDDDRPIVESISNVQVEEGNTATFTVELSNESTTQTLVRLKYTDSSATAPEDYGSAETVTIKYGDPEETVNANVVNGRFTVNIPAGVTSFDVLVDTEDDLHIDDNEQFALSARTDAQSGYVNGIATITDNEKPIIDLDGSEYSYEFVSENAGYDNVFGYYIYDESSGTQELHVLVGNSNDVSNPNLGSIDSLDNVDYFLIQDGAAAVKDANKLELTSDGQLVIDGNVSDKKVFIGNEDDSQLRTSTDADGNLILSFDDQRKEREDNDFDDLVVKVTKSDATTGYESTFTEGQTGVAIADLDADIFDDKDAVQSMTVTLTNKQAGDSIVVPSVSGFTVTTETIGSALVYLIVADAQGGVSASEFEDILDAIQFTNSSEDPDTTQREIEVKVTDGRGLESETATSLINVIPVADITVTSDSIGAEDSRIELDIDIPLGSSITQLEVSEIPPGAELYVDGEKVAITDGKAVFDANSLTKVEVKPKADSDVDFSVKVQGLDDNGDSVEQSHDVNVEVTPVADEPSLFVSNPTILASNNFEQVDLGRRSWRGNVSDEELNGGDSVGKWATDEDTGRGEVGKEGVYLGGRDQNKLFELEGGRQDNTLSTEFDAKAGNFYLISFDISARRVGSSPATLFLVSESGERTEIFDYETQVQGWSTQQVTFETPEEGTYTLVFESNQTDTYGALLDNIELTTVDNYGYEDSFINISDLVVGASRDTDGSEELTVILENLPKGTIVRTVGEDEITVGEDGIADISGWDDLVNLQIKFSEPSPEGEPYPVTVTVTSSEMDPNFPDESRTVSETINVTVVEIPPVVTEVSSLSVSEGDEAIFDVTLSNETRLETPITMTLTDGTASSDSDYTATSVVVTYFVDNVETTVTVDVDPTTGEFGFKLPANNDGFRVSVETTDDNNAPVFEGNETFVLNVATQAQDIERSGEATIQDGGENDGDNDRPVIESISDIQVEEGNTATFTVELSNESTTQTLVRLKYTDSSATAPEDYGSAESVTIKYGDPEETVSANVENGRFTVNIPAGVTSFDVLVDTQDDLHIDDNEQFALSARTDAQSGYVNGIATITDNEKPIIDLDGSEYSYEFVSENAGYDNVFGYYIYDESSGTQELHVLVGNSNDVSNPNLGSIDSLDNVDYFLIQDGAAAVKDANKLELTSDGQLVIDGNVSDKKVFIGNEDDSQLRTSTDADGNLILSFDDQRKEREDNDFDDLVIKVTKSDATTGYESTFTEGQTGVAIADLDADIFDDKDAVQSMTVTLTNKQAGDSIVVPSVSGFTVTTETIGSALVYLIVADAQGGVSASEFEDILDAIQFTNSSEDPDTTQREIEVIVTDGHGLESEVATSLINVIPVSGTPVTNELPTANSFSLSSEHSVAEVDFEPNATDVEDDAVPSKVTEVKLEDMPTSGKLYYEASAGVYLELTKGSEVTDTSKVFYVADRDAEVTRTIDSSDGAGVVSGVDSLTVDNITLSGGTIVGDQFVNDGQIKFDGNPSQGGFYVDSSLDNGQGAGHETQIGEYISIASEQGNISSLTVNFDSLNAHLGNGKAEIIAYIYDNGQLVDTQAVNITASDNHAGSSTIVSSTTTFDEVRLVAVSDDKNSNASFNIASVDLTANGSVDIEDSFTYWAIDSDNQQSPTLGTVSVSASTAIKSTPTLGGHIDSVTALVTGVDVQGKLIYGDLDWQASAATIYEKEIHSSISYDSVNGAVIEAGIGNDTVNMGSGSDTIFLGMSHSPIQDLTVTPNDHDSAIRNFAEENLSSLTWGLEDEALKVDGSSTPGLDVGHGGGGNDEIYGEEGQDIIFGGTGHDLLDGGDGNDAVRGGSGNDTIIGGQGNDFLTGDDGEDIFKWVDEPFSTHEDVIIDFTKGEDRLDFSELVGEESGSEMEALLAGIEVEVEGTGDEADIKLTVNHDGDTQVIVLQDAASQYSPSELSDTASLLNDLMSIKITTD